MEFTQDWMNLARQAMAGTQWKDPTLAMFALLAKLGAVGHVDRQPGGTVESGRPLSNLNS